VNAAAAQLVETGHAERHGDTLRLTPVGCLLADAIGAELLGAFAGTT
jgi:hypothetical protein